MDHVTVFPEYFVDVRAVPMGHLGPAQRTVFEYGIYDSRTVVVLDGNGILCTSVSKACSKQEQQIFSLHHYNPFIGTHDSELSVSLEIES